MAKSGEQFNYWKILKKSTKQPSLWILTELNLHQTIKNHQHEATSTPTDSLQLFTLSFRDKMSSFKYLQNTEN